MNKSICPILLFFITLVFTNSQTAVSQVVDTISYSDVYSFGTCTFNVSAKARSMRMSNKRVGNVAINYNDSNMPDSLKIAVSIAANVWEDYMGVGDSCRINVHFVDLLSEDIRTDVIYSRSENDGLYYPISLIKSKGIQHTNDIDANIYINSNVQWCVGIGESNGSSDKKLVLAMLQSIGRCLGYGSSVKIDKRGNFTFSVNNGMSAFDHLLFTEDDKQMANLNNNKRAEFQSFVQQDCGYVYAIRKNDRFRIYAPPIYEPQKSLKLSTDTASVMFYGEQKKRNLTIDDTTLGILSTIGWDFSVNSSVCIYADDIDNTGITSAYKEHTFHVESNGNILENHHWEFLLPLKDDGYETVAVSTNKDFIIPPIGIEDKYERNIEGDIRGIVSYSGVCDGQPVSDKYVVTLEIVPKIIKAEIIEIIPCDYDPTFYNAIVDVYYTGSHSLYSYVEEEFNASSASYNSNTPYYTRFYMTDIDSWRNVWINFRVTNNYGSDTYTIEIPADDIFMQKNEQQTTSIEDLLHASNIYCDVYMANGIYLKRINHYNELPFSQKGVYFLKVFRDNKYLKTIKFQNP